MNPDQYSIQYIRLLFSHSVVSSFLPPHELNPMNSSVLCCLPQFAQTHVHYVNDAIQLSHLSPPSPPAFNLFQHGGLFQWVSSLHQVAKVLLKYMLKNRKKKYTLKNSLKKKYMLNKKKNGPRDMQCLLKTNLSFMDFQPDTSSNIRSDQSLSRVQLFVTPWIAARQASLSITNSRSSLRLMSIESVMPSSHLTLSSPSPPVPNPSQHQSLFQWVNSSHEVAKVLEFQL